MKLKKLDKFVIVIGTLTILGIYILTFFNNNYFWFSSLITIGLLTIIYILMILLERK